MSERGSLAPELPQDEVALVEVLDRVLHTGVVLRGDVVLSVADIDLIYLKLELLLTSVANARAHARRDR